MKLWQERLKKHLVLTGKDAKRFMERMRETRVVPKEEIERVKKNYEYIISISKF